MLRLDIRKRDFVLEFHVIICIIRVNRKHLHVLVNVDLTKNHRIKGKFRDCLC